MAKTYKLSDDLQKVVTAAMKLPPYEQISCLVELALVRDMASQYISEYDKKRTKVEQEADENKRAKLQLDLWEFSTLVFEITEKVIKMCKIAADVDASGKDHISPMSLRYFIDGASDAARTTAQALWGDDKLDEFSARLEEAIKTTVKLPSAAGGNDNMEAVNKTPADDVDEMDATVPKRPVEEAAF